MVKPMDFIEKGLDSQMAGLFAVGLVVSFTAGLAMTGNTPVVESSQEDSSNWEGVYTVKVVRDGEVVYKEKEHNVLTDQGQNWIRSQIYNLSEANDPISAADTTNATFIAVGNGTAPSASTTQLDSEYTGFSLDRDAGVRKESAFPGQFAVETTYTASIPGDGSVVVNTTSLNWNSTGPSIVSGGSFTDATLLDGDQLTVTHNVTIS